MKTTLSVLMTFTLMFACSVSDHKAIPLNAEFSEPTTFANECQSYARSKPCQIALSYAVHHVREAHRCLEDGCARRECMDRFNFNGNSCVDAHDLELLEIVGRQKHCRDGVWCEVPDAWLNEFLINTNG